MEIERPRDGRIGPMTNKSPDMAPRNPRQIRVLIVEDEPLVAENLRADLVDAGFKSVQVAARVVGALQLIEKTKFDVAVLDANLAGMSSLPVAAALSEGGVPFIVLSGYARGQLQSEFSEAVYVQKPYRTDLLIEALDRLASTRSRN